MIAHAICLNCKPNAQELNLWFKIYAGETLGKELAKLTNAIVERRKCKTVAFE